MADNTTIGTRTTIRPYLNLTVINITYNFSQHHHHHHHHHHHQRQHILPSTSSCHGVLAFVIPVLLSLIQLKYQGNQTSPFATHPKSTGFAVVSLLLYCLAYDAEARAISSVPSRPRPTYSWIPARAMAVFGSLSMASLASILFPDSLCPMLCLLWLAGDLLLRLRKLLRGKQGSRRTILPL
ncbi:hypothetical protein RHMOL_Rhmol07G0135500 [Rhododendron molle]|uniref:Uncharacterized protein n=1 Tax=Rhododendron molle TaxID=49168 RepID=A0ACC0N262_RHOML|nr:hypothetical protein RHMOL_Rhmol07G0135500 [Rhododendron molle]